MGGQPMQLALGHLIFTCSVWAAEEGKRLVPSAPYLEETSSLLLRAVLSTPTGNAAIWCAAGTKDHHPCGEVCRRNGGQDCLEL